MQSIIKRCRGILIDIAAPLVLFYGLRAGGVSDMVALIVGMVPPLGSALYSLARTRRTDAFGMLVLAAMVLSLIASLLAGSPRDLLVRNALVSAPLGIWVLVTVWRGTPISFEVTRTLMPQLAPAMDRLWVERPRFRRAWRQITAMWGILGLVDAGLRIYFSYTLAVATVPVLDIAVTIGTVVALQIPTHLFLRRSGCWVVLFERRARAAYLASAPMRRRADPHATASSAAASHRFGG
ncbi:hypothetical protein CLV47_10999 [Antricoccus suffuscus]|uniref:Intracellular septation protein A n=1 Tax=Antricoccus suffuscus TaxID=1629062 RepID=A0A2T0ZYW8_9ACTN|nr:VC0807 family protein [Antricoccus suffuscus]PRZ41552.1 hypothetical protein CLV47_10999 [Antricoccus suffuscus]